MAADLGISYASKDNLTNVAFVAQNIGGQITTYYNSGYQRIKNNLRNVMA